MDIHYLKVFKGTSKVCSGSKWISYNLSDYLFEILKLVICSVNTTLSSIINFIYPHSSIQFVFIFRSFNKMSNSLKFIFIDLYSLLIY